MLMITAAGRLGKDGQLRRIQAGDQVLSFSIAVTVYKDKTEWIECSVWGDRAEKLAPYLLKGVSVAVAGEASTRVWEGKGILCCRVDKLTLLGGGKRDDAPASKPQQSTADYLSDDVPF